MVEVRLKKIEIPPLGFHLLIDVELNGEKLYLVLDTGASRSVIDKAFLEQLNPSAELTEDASFSAGVGSSDLKSHTAIIEEIKMGDLNIKNYEIAVMDLQHVILSYEKINEGPIYGVIGGDLLMAYNAIIDYSKSILILEEKAND